MAAGNYHGTYSPDKLVVIVGGVICSGFTDGDFVSAAYDEDRYTKMVGADGEVGRAKNPSRSGTVTVKLSQTSPANDQLTGITNLESLSGVDAPIPISITDLSGRTVIASSKAWIKTPPEVTFGKEIGPREWVFDCADLVIYVGGSN